MGSKTKIDWCDKTWNPVTGCLHGCEYCYARRTANRFGGYDHQHFWDSVVFDGKIARLKHELMRTRKDGKLTRATYPFGFIPTLHEYRLEPREGVFPLPQMWKEPSTIFVCSMADLFGEWVPDEWIAEVFRVCEAAPQHKYLFLTKNPERYFALHEDHMLPNKENFYYGITMDTKWNALKSLRKLISAELAYSIGGNPFNHANVFASVEPMLEDFEPDVSSLLFAYVPWVIVGAETGNRKGIVKPKKAWIDRLVEESEQFEGAIFMKNSLRGLMGDDFRQEFPWKAAHR